MSTRRGSFGSGSGSSTKLIDESIFELISSEITRGILDASLVMFGTIKVGSWSCWMGTLGLFVPRLRLVS